MKPFKKSFAVLLLLSFALICSATDTIPKQDTNNADSAQIVISKDTITQSEEEEFTGVIDGALALVKDAQESFKESNPKGFAGVLSWLFAYLLAGLSTMKLVQITRTWNLIKKYFIKVETETIVKGVSLFVAAALTLATMKGEFSAERFSGFAVVSFLLSDLVYQFMKKRGWIGKTPKAVA